MGRPPKPTALKVLQGTAQPCRMNPHEPEPVGELGPPPAYFDKDEKQAWIDISVAVPHGVAFGSDSLVVEIAAKLMAEFRRGEISGAKLQVLRGCLAEFGMTPASRSRIVVKKDKLNARFERFK